MNPEEEGAAQKLVTEAYALVGAVSTGFATIEFHLQFLLSVLISGKELAPEAMLVLRQKQFGQRIVISRQGRNRLATFHGQNIRGCDFGRQHAAPLSRVTPLAGTCSSRCGG